MSAAFPRWCSVPKPSLDLTPSLRSHQSNTTTYLTTFHCRKPPRALSCPVKLTTAIARHHHREPIRTSSCTSRSHRHSPLISVTSTSVCTAGTTTLPPCLVPSGVVSLTPPLSLSPILCFSSPKLFFAAAESEQIVGFNLISYF